MTTLCSFRVYVFTPRLFFPLRSPSLMILLFLCAPFIPKATTEPEPDGDGGKCPNPSFYSNTQCAFSVHRRRTASSFKASPPTLFPTDPNTHTQYTTRTYTGKLLRIHYCFLVFTTGFAFIHFTNRAKTKVTMLCHGNNTRCCLLACLLVVVVVVVIVIVY